MKPSCRPTGTETMTERKSIRLSQYSARLGVDFYCEPDGRVIGTGRLNQEQEGPPGYSHGGVLSALLDEAMGAAAWLAGHPVLAANLNIDFRRPVPLGVEIKVIGRADSVEGRKIYTSGIIYLPGESIAAEGKGLFVVAPDLFSGFNPFQYTGKD